MKSESSKILFISLVISIILSAIKFAAWLITNSTAVYTDAMESLINIAAGSFALYSIHLAAKPKDVNHPYGHGKIEFFSTGFEGGLIVIAGFSILFKAFWSIAYPESIINLVTGAFFIGFTGIVNAITGYTLIARSKKLNSMTLQADGKHLITDAISSGAIVLGLLIIQFTGFLLIDSIISIAAGLFIFYQGYLLLRKSISGLMDETDLPLLNEIIEKLKAERRDEWIDVHNLRVQRYGADVHVDCHLTLPYYLQLNQVHDQISFLDSAATKAQTNAEFFIHTDPCIPSCCQYCRVKNCAVRQYPKTLDINWTIENMVKNQKHKLTIDAI